MKVTATRLPGVVLVEPDVYRDLRGFLAESFHVARTLFFRTGDPDDRAAELVAFINSCTTWYERRDEICSFAREHYTIENMSNTLITLQAVAPLAARDRWK